MYATEGILTFSFPAGRWLGAQFRLSFLMPVVLMALMWRFSSVSLGFLAGTILLASLILHECAHLFTARFLGGDILEIVIWPLGGLGPLEPGYQHRSPLWIALSGPVSNLLVATACMYPLSVDGQLGQLLNPFGTYIPDADASLGDTIIQMLFLVNWSLGLVNLVPVIPMDGGQICRWFLSLRLSEIECSDLMLRAGLVAGLLGLLGGFVFNESSLATLSAFILILHIHGAAAVIRQPPPRDESFLGYDFSAGYTSLARSDTGWKEAAAPETDSDFEGGGIMDRWKTRREEERRRRDEENRQREAQQVDEILEKLHQNGRESLSTAELRLLDQFSERLRQRNSRT
jgi:stage IV sporulation protein FB